MSMGMMLAAVLTAVLADVASSAEPAAVEVRQGDSAVTIENSLVRVSYDLAKGAFAATDKKRDRIILAGATAKLGDFSSSAPGVANTFKAEPLGDALGLGRSLLITSAVPGGPKLLLRISLYNNHGFIALAAGLENTTDKVIQLKEFSPLDGGMAFKAFDTQTCYSALDGHGGGVKTFVTHDGKKRTSRNNLLVTFGNPGANRSLVMGGLTYTEFEKYAEAARAADGSLTIRLYANDPVGKRIDPGACYLPEDRFYVDFLTDNPFDALEAYADRLRLAQGIVLPVYRFPIVDTWFAQVPHFGGGEDRAGYRARNDSVGAVEEMECVARSGFLKYAPVAVLLEPDLYDLNNQQGWWDDEHWQRGPNNRAKGAGSWSSSNGQFVPPYETARKWAGAVRALGGIPMIYVQTGFRSQDYAEKFPGHMIGNESNVPHLNDKGEQQYRDKEKKTPRKLGYDYTDPGFIRHVRDVWENLRLAGIQGVKFDYPDYPFTGWPVRGGMEDPYATTAMHYRNVFRLARDGLGPESYLHERTLERGSDVALGLVASQRTEGDTDKIDPAMVSRVGLRWYKNRVVVNYDMDGKNPFHAVPDNRDGQRSMLTMTYVASGALMIVPSFGRMTAEQLRDLSRLYPFHSGRRSARPVGAFTSTHPQVYDFKVSPQWHQLKFYNTDTAKEAKIGVDLAGDTAFGALGLEAAKEYYVYDFWNDALVGKVPGGKRLEQTLRPGEARQMSVREAEANPQVLATDRHLMQGYVDMLGCSWDAAKKQLRGVSAVVGGEAYRVIIAINGRKPGAATVEESIEQSVAKSRFGAAKSTATAKVRMLPGNAGLAELALDRSDNGPVAWAVTFEDK
ncbi:MAG: hypothetical protein NT049_13270 [Planctomycetota bacterium]|nr:hypothetical protein [Planctomycetota bacterium]